MIFDHKLIGIVAGIIATAGFVPYIVAIIKNQNRPSKASWIIWTIVGAAIAVGYKDSGGGAGVWVAVSYAVCPAIILGLTYYKNREKIGVWPVADKLCLAIGIAIFIPWVIFKTVGGDFPQWNWILPRITLYGAIAVDAFGAIPTIIKSWKNPKLENLGGWTFWFVANWFNLLAIENWSFDEALYPIYISTPATLIFLPLLLNRIKTYWGK